MEELKNICITLNNIINDINKVFNRINLVNIDDTFHENEEIKTPVKLIKDIGYNSYSKQLNSIENSFNKNTFKKHAEIQNNTIIITKFMNDIIFNEFRHNQNVNYNEFFSINYINTNDLFSLVPSTEDVLKLNNTYLYDLYKRWSNELQMNIKDFREIYILVYINILKYFDELFTKSIKNNCLLERILFTLLGNYNIYGYITSYKYDIFSDYIKYYVNYTSYKVTKDLLSLIEHWIDGNNKNDEYFEYIPKRIEPSNNKPDYQSFIRSINTCIKHHIEYSRQNVKLNIDMIFNNFLEVAALLHLYIEHCDYTVSLFENPLNDGNETINR